jgi:DNA repair exonuclease SbcCD ATPase subunit/DNA repair exonuclease SbcCD nuclease subunit
MKIAHISDIHIRNYRYHYEYEQVFEQLYAKLEELKPDLIVNTGDTAHTKLNLSPSYFDMAVRMFERLADIAPYHIILGNHDLNLRNLSKIDAVSPLVAALSHPDIHFHKYSAEVDIGNGFCFHVLSIVDEENWTLPTSMDKVNIALFHGSVAGVKTSTGWTMTHGDISLDRLTEYDYVLLGDIHKPNQELDKEGRIRYAGSLVQQNFGESEEKGFLLWDIEDVDNFKVKHYALENPKPFVTINLTKKGKIPSKAKIPEGCRLRLVSEANLPMDVIKRTIELAKTKYNPETTNFYSKVVGKRNSEDAINTVFKDDLRSVEVQEGLIQDYLKDYELEEETLQQIFALNQKYNKLVTEEEEISRNVHWSVKNLEWDNLFNYGEGNSIDFNNLEGIVGIFGKNFSGKSSIVDSFLYTLFNTTSKNERKNLNVINQNKENGKGSVAIDIGTDTYHIERTSDKYEKKLKGSITTEAKTNIEFYKVDNLTGEETPLNGDTRAQTDKNIRSVFGSIDDFLLTSMGSQIDSLAYINEGSTKRKEILAKFLDLEVFEKKFKKAKDDAADLRVAIKKMKDREFGTELKDKRKELAINEAKIDIQKREAGQIKEQTQEFQESVSTLKTKIGSIPDEIIEIQEVLEEIKENKQQLQGISSKEKEYMDEIAEKLEFIKKFEAFQDVFNIDEALKNKQLGEDLGSEIDSLMRDVEVLELKFNNQSKKASLLNEVPCGPKFSSCKFIKDAYDASSKVENTKVALKELRMSKGRKQADLIELDHEKNNERIEKFTRAKERKNKYEKQVKDIKLDIERNKIKSLQINNNLNDLIEKREKYEDNKEAIENLQLLIKEKKKLEKIIDTNNKAVEKSAEGLLELYKRNGSLEQQYKQIEFEQKEYETLNTSFSTYDLYMKCMHSNGIAYALIKQSLPILNQEIQKILSNVVDFEVMFDNEDNKLDILIKHPKYDSRPIEMGSGAEKTITAMAIRLALLNVSTLPVGDIMILDEPGTALDEENMEGFIRILDIIKNEFKTIFLISHLEVLKDVVDKQIIINKEDGYAKVNE